MRTTHWAGRATALHGRPVRSANGCNELIAVRPAIVIGRAQKIDEHIADRAAAAGFELVRRVSGGTAVVVGLGECLWVDVVVARDAPGWNDDIGKAGCWMGDRWVEALAEAGVPGTTVHRTGMLKLPGADIVCFAGIGPGEVLTADGRKLVGISQRRTRDWALFQCAIPLRWDLAPLVDVFGEPADAARDAAVATLDAATAQATLRALADSL